MMFVVFKEEKSLINITIQKYIEDEKSGEEG